LLPDLYKKIEDLVDKTALIKSLKEPEDKIGEFCTNLATIKLCWIKSH
jgi:hypothetical protein